MKACTWAGVPGLIAAIVATCVLVYEAEADSPELSQPLTVAFIADQGAGAGARAVLQLIKNEGADVVLHQGDFDYRDDPDSWDDLITDVLGAEFPYFASVGNHDIEHFYDPDGCQAKLKSRLSRLNGARCVGDLGVQSACTFRGLFLAQDPKDDAAGE